MKTLLLGMGNPILSDDGVGLFLARKLEKQLPGVDVATISGVGLHVLDLIAGYDRLFVIDASIAKRCGPGEIVRFTSEENGCLHLFSSHGLNFFDLLRLGKALGYEIPEVAGIYGIELGDEVFFGHEFTPQLKAKIVSIREEIAGDIKECLSKDTQAQPSCRS